ncbi:peptide ABC transporter permease [Methylobacterium durans]|uniref:peptide ABC transporter permease n=1 Tax=Methylobacterium durans TaxID=2202825 RepID=UPI002B0007A7|nr:peptide ABC transporter permease [Methylobacterium durans]MEA1831794.1 peptide ABC transporter permease [Methylobacterium durans]
MSRASNTTVDPALDAAALLRRVGFFGLFVIIPVVAQVGRRATVVLTPIAIVLLILASALDGRQRPLKPAISALVRSPAFLAGSLVILWAALSLAWTPFLGSAAERVLNLLATILLTLSGYLALPDRMRSANLYLLPLGVTAGGIVAVMIGLFGDALVRSGAEDDQILDRGLIMLALLVWPAIAWLRSRHRDREALVTALIVAAAIAASPKATQIIALTIGAAAFLLTTVSPRIGVAVTAGITAALLALAPLIPFVGRPIGATLLGSGHPGVLSLKAWQKVVTSEPVRLVTGHGFETALRGRAYNLLPGNAPSTMLFELWYELGIVGALAAAYALYISIHRIGRDAPALAPGAMAAIATAYTIACIGIGLAVMWWFTTLTVAILVFVSIQRGQFRSRRPKISLLRRIREDREAGAA